MERFIDSFSKRLATAVSRRDVLRMTSQTMFGVLLSAAGIRSVWAASSGGGTGTSACGAVQQSIQLAVGNDDPTKYANRGTYVSAVAKRTSVAVTGALITDDCADCIVAQFAEGIPVASQSACGTIVTPTATCDALQPSESQITAAAVLLVDAAPGAWSNPTQWSVFINLAQGMLGCTLSTADSVSSAASNAINSAALAASPSALASNASGFCGTPNVNYCGPDNSLVNPKDPTVAPCLNQECFNHDSCYTSSCVPEGIPAAFCNFSASTALCDAPLIRTFETGCATQTVETALVCAYVLCATNSIPIAICAAQFATRSAACAAYLLTQPPCENMSCTGAEAGQQACGPVCCPCGESCLDDVKGICGTCPVGQVAGPNGTCFATCPSGLTLCGASCCSANQACVNGLCANCASGETGCGATCCAPGQTCSNGSCVSTGCPPGETSCGGTCCSANQFCSNGTCVATCPNNQITCGTTCCSGACSNGACVPLNCGTGNFACGGTCCGDQFSGCCVTNTSGLVGCISSPDYVCCPSTGSNLPGQIASICEKSFLGPAGCCPGHYGCGGWGVGSSRVDLQACKLEYSIVSPK